MKPAGPVDDDVGGALIEARRAAQRSACVCLAVLVQPVEDGAILTDVETVKRLAIDGLCHVLRGDRLEEVDVLVGVEGGEVCVRRVLRPEHVEVLVHAIRDDQVVGEPYTVRTHRMARTIVKIAHRLVVKIVDARPRGRRRGHVARHLGIRAPAHMEPRALPRHKTIS